MNPFRVSRIDMPNRIPVLASAPIPMGEESVQLRLFDPIDSWGGDWGVSAKEFVSALDALPESTKEIRLLINSPGGEVYEGLAILNALRAHPARVVAVVQGIAASAASFIAAGADELVMMRNSELFIHNAWGIAMGDAEVMRDMAKDLDHIDRNLAGIYADKSGQSAEHWLSQMGRDTYLSADEAVAAGLADRIEGEIAATEAAAAKARFNLAALTKRSHKLPVSAEPGESNRKEIVVTYDELAAGLRERLGVTDADADGEALLAALDEALAAEVEPPAAPEIPEGAQLIDAGVLAQLQADAAAGREALEAQAQARREGIIAAAVREGRITTASTAAWLAQLEKDEAGASALLATLAPNTTPVTEIGHQLDMDADEQLYAQAWGSKSEED